MMTPEQKRTAFRALPQAMREWYVSDELGMVLARIATKYGISDDAADKTEAVLAEVLLGGVPRGSFEKEVIARTGLDQTVAGPLCRALTTAFEPPRDWDGLGDSASEPRERQSTSPTPSIDSVTIRAFMRKEPNTHLLELLQDTK